MKRTLMLTMLATALLGGQVFAADPTGTGIEGYDESVSSGSNYYGKYSKTESATGGDVTVKKEPTGEVLPNAFVYGGRTEAADASNNMVTMQDGTISNIYGGYGKTGASNNTVVLRGGTVRSIRGGDGASGVFSNNVVIVTGGTVTSFIWGGYGGSGSAASNNRVHLVGKGASNVFIADGQEITSSYEYTGGEDGISIGAVSAGYINTSTAITTDNSIDIYGTGISFKVGGMIYMQILTFNITNNQAVAQTQEAAVFNKSALNLTGVDLQVKDLDVKEWTPGKTITLVQSEQEIKGADEELTVGKEVEIKRGEVVTATATLKLGDDKKSLILTNIQGKNVPEPTTGTLSLLALAALAARRRRK